MRRQCEATSSLTYRWVPVPPSCQMHTLPSSPMSHTTAKQDMVNIYFVFTWARTNKEWDESVALVHLYRLGQLVAAQAQVLVALDVADLDEADEAGLLDGGVRLVGAVGHQAAVDLGAAHVGNRLLVPISREQG